MVAGGVCGVVWCGVVVVCGVARCEWWDVVGGCVWGRQSTMGTGGLCARDLCVSDLKHELHISMKRTAI